MPFLSSNIIINYRLSFRIIVLEHNSLLCWRLTLMIATKIFLLGNVIGLKKLCSYIPHLVPGMNKTSLDLKKPGSSKGDLLCFIFEIKNPWFAL